MKRFAGTVLAFGALALGACGSGTQAAEPNTPTPTAPGPDTSPAPMVTPEELTAAPGHLDLAEIKLLKDGKPALVLHPDGTLDLPVEGRIAGRIERDGRFLDPRGELIATFTPEGEIVLGEDHYLPVTIDEQGQVKLLKEDRTIRLLPDGTLEGVNPNGPAITVEGADDATRRTAMFMLVLASYQVSQRPR